MATQGADKLFLELRQIFYALVSGRSHTVDRRHGSLVAAIDTFVHEALQPWAERGHCARHNHRL